MAPPAVIADLVERFARNREAYRSGPYNETQLRREFVDPFFKALGWDLDNEQGYAEAYKDVIHEDAIRIAGGVKAPDYCFRIGGTRKFFVEAKKPSVDIRGGTHPAYQLRRYAWSAKLPLSILTDFEEFAVYDCRARPAQNDKASKARVLYLTCPHYAERWDDIASVFARDAVLKGSFDKYAESTKRKRGTTEVDDAFLSEIESWRDLLARHIALRNPALSQRELNFAVQRTIDRIIFLRICEDRGIERYGRLQALLNGQGVYGRLFQLFDRADERYNSGLFHFQRERGRDEAPDTLTPALAIDDKPLKTIIARLYYPDSPYEFSVLPADILGQVYEQFLGKIIRLTPGHRAVVEDKPEVKKAGGVYYTPTYIVDYIVEHTVGKLLERKTPRSAAKLRILDPACGSGSFLLGAYQRLLDWHLAYYTAHDPEKHAKGRSPSLYQAGTAASRQSADGSRHSAEGSPQSAEGSRQSAVGRPQSAEANRQSAIGNRQSSWRLTTAERKRILLNNIHGVDIDPQAVEVTKLSLLLKVLEGESGETLLRQYELFHERALPDLSCNIKCGNSLIGPDFYAGRQMTLFDEDERLRINVFDWQAEFPAILAGKTPGFDAVIGNPPYHKVSGRTDPMVMRHFKGYYVCAAYKTELYALFAERSFALLSQGGLHSFIVPNSFLAGVHLRSLRCVLAEDNTLMEVVLLKDVQVFRNAKMDSVVYVAGKRAPKDGDTILMRVADNTLQSAEGLAQTLSVAEWRRSEGRHFRVIGSALPSSLLDRLRSSDVRLGDIATVHLGLIVSSQSLFTPEPSESSPDPILLGRNIGRYSHPKPQNWFSFARDPIVGGTKNPDVYDTGPRLAVQAIRNLKLQQRLVATIVPAGVFTTGTLHNIIARDERVTPLYLLGLINSKLLNEFYAASFPEHRIKGAYLQSLPIRLVEPDDHAQLARHDRVVSLVDRILLLHKQLASARTAHEQTAVRRQIDATDREIDGLVYELYGLTEGEIAIVEEASRS